MLIAIMSDSHEHRDNLNKAVAIANERKAEHLLFAGDLMAPGFGTAALLKFNGHIHFIAGNNDGEQMIITAKLLRSGHADVYAGSHADLELGGAKIFMTHYDGIGPYVAKAQEHDLVVYGHNHTWHLEKCGDTTLLNPGAILGNKEPASFAFFDTQSKEVEKVILE